MGTLWNDQGFITLIIAFGVAVLLGLFVTLAHLFHANPNPPIQPLPYPRPAPEPWVLRVIVEKKELDDKIDLLTAFLTTHQYNTLLFTDRLLMKRQLEAMTIYSQILAARLRRRMP